MSGAHSTVSFWRRLHFAQERAVVTEREEPALGAADELRRLLPHAARALAAAGAARAGLKCRWCGYEAPAFTTGDDGRRQSGYTLLRKHVASEHAEEMAAIQRAERELDEALRDDLARAGRVYE